MGIITKARVAMVAAEFLGAGLLTYTALSISGSDLPLAFFIAAGVGVMLALIVSVFGPISGGHANPAVTLGFWSIRKVSTLRALAYIAAQLAGGVLAYRLFITMARVDNVEAFTWPNPGDNSDFWILLFAELISAALFTMVIAAVVHKRYQGAQLAGFIGTALFAAIMLASIVPKPSTKLVNGESRYFQGIVNPVVAVGTQNYGWEYVLGPIAGGIVGMNLYTYLFTDASFKRLTVAARTSSAKTTTVRKTAAKKPAKRKTASRSKKK